MMLAEHLKLNIQQVVHTYVCGCLTHLSSHHTPHQLSNLVPLPIKSKQINHPRGLTGSEAFVAGVGGVVHEVVDHVEAGVALWAVRVAAGGELGGGDAGVAVKNTISKTQVKIQKLGGVSLKRRERIGGLGWNEMR